MCEVRPLDNSFCYGPNLFHKQLTHFKYIRKAAEILERILNYIHGSLLSFHSWSAFLFWGKEVRLTSFSCCLCVFAFVLSNFWITWPIFTKIVTNGLTFEATQSLVFLSVLQSRQTNKIVRWEPHQGHLIYGPGVTEQSPWESVTQLIKRFIAFYGTEASFPYSQEPVTGP
jgi:hypothetical protein